MFVYLYSKYVYINGLIILIMFSMIVHKYTIVIPTEVQNNFETIGYNLLNPTLERKSFLAEVN